MTQQPRAIKSVQRRTVRSTIFFVVFVCVSLLAVNFWLAYRAHEQTLQQAVINNSNLAASVSQQLGSMTADVTHVLESVALELELDTDGNGPQTLSHLQPIFKSHVEKNEHVYGLFLYDAQGSWLLSSNSVIPIGANNADRDYFIHHRNDPSLDAWVSKPVISRSSREWILPVSRRLNDSAGNFAGVILATVSVAHVSRALADFKIGQKGSIALALTDGTILVRRPFAVASLGQKLPAGDLLNQISTQEVGAFETVSPVDGVLRLGSFKRMPRSHLLAVVALSKDELLASWQQTTLIQSAWMLLLCVVTGLAGTRVIHSVRQRVKAELHLGATRDELTQANARLAQLASHDGLTGLANRRYFDEMLERAWAESCRSGQPVSLVMIDVDHFKRYNDTYGHPQGDLCLQRVAQALQSTARRPMDFVARYGGEEMAIVLPNTDLAGALIVAELAREAVQNMQLPHAASPLSHVTVSLGIATHGPRFAKMDVQELIEDADRNLYRAKNAGRNMVMSYEAQASKI
ncbi:MAG: diguanylate cyclase [Pseudomonas sp.]|nr:MAG: diguanylate cyclase [Pseudomonas sp.]